VCCDQCGARTTTVTDRSQLRGLWNRRVRRWEALHSRCV